MDGVTDTPTPERGEFMTCSQCGCHTGPFTRSTRTHLHWAGCIDALKLQRDALRAEVARKDAEIAAFRAFLEGAEYPKIDKMAKMDPHDARNLGIVVAALTRELSNPGAPRDGE